MLKTKQQDASVIAVYYINDVHVITKADFVRIIDGFVSRWVYAL